MAHPIGDNRTIQEMAQEFEAQTGIAVLPSQKLKRAINHEASHVSGLEKICWLVISNTYLILTGMIILFRGKAPKEWINLGLEFSKRAVYRRLEIADKLPSVEPKKEEARKRHHNMAVDIN